MDASGPSSTKMPMIKVFGTAFSSNSILLPHAESIIKKSSEKNFVSVVLIRGELLDLIKLLSIATLRGDAKNISRKGREDNPQRAQITFCRICLNLRRRTEQNKRLLNFFIILLCDLLDGIQIRYSAGDFPDTIVH